MKWLALIFPLYFLILSCLPCADVEDDMTIDSPSIAITSSHKHDKNAEACSPFCTCNCCGQRVANQKQFAVKAVLSAQTGKIQPLLQSFALQNVLHQIWQPPQLV